MADDSNESNEKNTSQQIPIDDNQQWWLKFVPDSNQWTDVNISRFLSIYRTHPILWDPTHSFHKDQSSSMKAYGLIARKLNLHGIKETECIKLVKSLKDLYAKEKNRQMIATGRCSQKYTPPPTWYHMLKELVDSVQEKLANVDRKDSLSANPDLAEPWEACCARLYTEDIWTPKHFETNVADWFLPLQDEPLLCTCQEFPATNSEDIRSTETSSTDHGNSVSNSSSEKDRYSTNESSLSSKSCCCNVENLKSPEWCGADISNDEMEMCDRRIPKKKAKTSSFCNNYAVNDTKIWGSKKIGGKMEGRFKNKTRCPSANVKQCDANIESSSSEAMNSEVTCCNLQETPARKTCYNNSDHNNNIPKTNKKCKTIKRQQIRGNELVRCKNSETISEEETDISDVCGGEEVQKLVYAKNDQLPCEKRIIAQEACGGKCENEFLPCGEFKLRESRLKSCPGPKKLPECCNIRVATCGNGESVVSSTTETSSITESADTCCIGCNKTSVIMDSQSSSRSSSTLLKCRSLSEKEDSDNRLEYHPDPTLCERCAVNRMPVSKAHENIIELQDPRMLDLDKYCYYKDWDAIYNIKTRVPDEEPIFKIDEDLLSAMGSRDESPIQKRQNYSPTEADVNLFIYPESSDARQVSLNDEYKWENGLNIKIDQPKHYACEISDILDHKPAQLIL